MGTVQPTILFLILAFFIITTNGIPIEGAIITALPLELALLIIALTNLWHHIIIILILLEFFRIKGFLIIRSSYAISLHPSFMFIYLVLIVCEASLGLSLVTRLTRGVGGDELNYKMGFIFTISTYMRALIICVVLSLRAEALPIQWALLELNILCFIPILSAFRTSRSTVNRIKYFTTQRSASLLFIIAVRAPFSTSVIFVALIIFKMAIPPFQR